MFSILDQAPLKFTAIVVFLLAGTVLGTAAFGSQASEPAAAQVSLRQQGQDLQLTVRARQPIGWAEGSRVCLRFSERKRNPAEVCVRQRGPKGRTSADVRRLSGSGAVRAKHRMPAQVRARPKLLSLRFLMADAGIVPGRLSWQVAIHAAAKRCADPAECEQLIPPDSVRSTPVRKVTGCVARGAFMRRSGPDVPRVALTFDDGPSLYTPAFLKSLDRYRVRATFFVLGQQVGGRAQVLQQMLRRGHEIGNHSYAHRMYPGTGDLAQTNRVIHSATGYRPCAFRAPYGAVNAGVIGGARSLGMLTIGWNDDPSDYRSPGAGAIAASALAQARKGSIILLHDGGGTRSQTLAAVPAIIKGLRARGYEFVTVQELLGLRYRYG